MLFFDTKELLSKIKVLPLLKETNFNMTKKRFMKQVTIDAAMSFQEKEDCIFRGLLKYIGDSLGEYLTVDQVVSLAQTLRRLRNRPAEVEFSEDLCSLVSEDAEIRNRYIPRKILRRDECSVLFYNLAPYALLGRRHASILAKMAFPNFFASAATISSTFTKFSKIPGSEIETISPLSIAPFPEHSTNAVELILFNLGVKDQS